MCAKKVDSFVDQRSYVREKGRREGREEGSQAMCRTFLTRLLERDIGPVPKVVVERINAAQPDQLQDWLDLVIDGERPAALLEP